MPANEGIRPVVSPTAGIRVHGGVTVGSDRQSEAAIGDDGPALGAELGFAWDGLALETAPGASLPASAQRIRVHLGLDAAVGLTSAATDDQEVTWGHLRAGGHAGVQADWTTMKLYQPRLRADAIGGVEINGGYSPYVGGRVELSQRTANRRHGVDSGGAGLYVQLDHSLAGPKEGDTRFTAGLVGAF